MCKQILTLLLGSVLLASCQSENYTSRRVPAPAAYTDWERAMRVDADMQNMYASTPRKIEKPIDMYMAFALALKYNYTRRAVSYEQSLLEVGGASQNRLPEIFSAAGYVNATNGKDVDSELKLAWNLLDVGTVYYQSQDSVYSANLAYEQSRKVIHNLMQETRYLYWKTLTAQKILPVVDDMIEYLTLEVDEMNAKSNELAAEGRSSEMGDLVKKRKYMEMVKKLSDSKRDLENAEVRLASLMGFHPSTQYKLVGAEYGNFVLPEIKSSLSEMEWLALTNRPELRMRDITTSVEEIKANFKVLDNPGEKAYQSNRDRYNRLWAQKARDVGMQVFENAGNPSEHELETLRRERMTNLILTQVYVAWARYQSAYEDYQISGEIANVSEDIAEDTTISSGSKDEKSHLESARAIEDEVNAMEAYVNLQDSLGNLYAALGLDAIPYYMLSEKPSKIAFYLRGELEKWRKGQFMPDNRPYLLDVPVKRPPVKMSAEKYVSDVTLETGQGLDITIPESILKQMDFTGKVTMRAGLIDDSPLPDWLHFDAKRRRFYGTAMPSNIGDMTVKVYVSDEGGSVAYFTFNIKIVDVYVPSVELMGLTPGRKATVLKRCLGAQCTDEYIDEAIIGEEVETSVKR